MAGEISSLANTPSPLTLEGLMVKKGLKPAAKKIHKEYATKVLGFQAWLRGQLDRLL